MFSFGGSEFIIIVVVALLLFGPDKIPQLARTIGRFTREFNKYKNIMESTLNAEIYRAEGPTKDEMTIEERIAKAGAASSAFTDDRDSVIDDEAERPPETESDAITGPRPMATPSADEADEEDEE